MGPDAVQRTELAHQHKVQALVGAGALQRRLVGRRFHHTQLAVSRRLSRQVLHTGASVKVWQRSQWCTHRCRLQRLRQRAGAFTVVLQQVKGHALTPT
jgi:hypothetical protein